MKKITIILLTILSLTACNKTYREDDWQDTHQIDLTDLVQSYDLWYVDIERTEGPGNVSFMSKAFTMSFMPNYEVYANNNIVGLGISGNGYGISTGTYQVFDRDHIISINDDIDGIYDFEVVQISQNEIKLVSRSENVSYYLTGYQKSDFDYDALFYDNITYFLQEYEAWTKTFTNILSPSEPFVNENHLTFYVEGNDNVFESSESPVTIAPTQIYWDYTGTYEVLNARQNNRKELYLYYDLDNSQETFLLTIIDDQHIRLQNTLTDNVYEFEGHGYIQYRPKAQRLKSKFSKKHIFDYKKTQS